MGNYRFRLSDMIPNAWFYKLKDMSKGSRKQCTSNFLKKKSSLAALSQTPNIISQPRYTYYFTTGPTRTEKFYTSSSLNPKYSDTHFLDSPRKSSKKKTKRKTIYKPSPKLFSSSSESEFQESIIYESKEEEEEKDDDDDDNDNDSFDQLGSCCSSCNCKVSSSTSDIIIDVNGESFNKKIEGFNTVSEVELPRILTKPTNFDGDEMTRTKYRRKSSSSSKSVGIRLRTNSPRIGNRKIQTSLSRNKTLSESFAVVKSSIDPQKDFKDSMVEMIAENNIRGSKDLEDLLACYLSLNSKEYHDLIVKAFEQIWFDMTDLRL